MSTAAPSLEVVDLRVEIEYGAHEDIVDGISFQVAGGEVLGLVGESGSGKTTVGLALLGHTRRGARIARGEVRIEGRDILPLPPLERQRLRGRLVSYVPQDPASALSPAMRIGTQLEETLSEHGFGCVERGAARHASSRSWARCCCRATTRSSGATRTSSPADSSSGWRSRWRSPTGRG